MSKPETENEGEGSRSAAKDYNDRTRRFVESGEAEERAEEAAAALDSEEGEALRRAEDEGRAKAREQDPQVER